MKKLIYLQVFETNFRELYNGCTLNIKGEKGNNTIITIDKSRKEYLLPTEKIDVLKLLQNKDVSKESLFVDGEGYERIRWNKTERVFLTESEILEQLTPFGKELYLLNEYGKEVINAFNSML